jgi:Mg/Co/Ni transporter MgtE
MNAQPARKRTIIREIANGVLLGGLLAGTILCTPYFEHFSRAQGLSFVIVGSTLAATVQGLVAYWFFVE